MSMTFAAIVPFTQGTMNVTVPMGFSGTFTGTVTNGTINVMGSQLGFAGSATVTNMASSLPTFMQGPVIPPAMPVISVPPVPPGIDGLLQRLRTPGLPRPWHECHDCKQRFQHALVRYILQHEPGELPHVGINLCDPCYSERCAGDDLKDYPKYDFDVWCETYDGVNIAELEAFQEHTRSMRDDAKFGTNRYKLLSMELADMECHAFNIKAESMGLV